MCLIRGDEERLCFVKHPPAGPHQKPLRTPVCKPSAGAELVWPGKHRLVMSMVTSLLLTNSARGSLCGSSRFYFTFRCVRRVPFEALWLLTSRGVLCRFWGISSCVSHAGWKRRKGINVLMDGNCWQKSSKWTYVQITLLGLASLLFDNLWWSTAGDDPGVQGTETFSRFLVLIWHRHLECVTWCHPSAAPSSAACEHPGHGGTVSERHSAAHPVAKWPVDSVHAIQGRCGLSSSVNMLEIQFHTDICVKTVAVGASFWVCVPVL